MVRAREPRMDRAALSYAKAASSAVSKVPSQCLSLVEGSRISAAYRPHGLLRTPRYLPPHAVSCFCSCVVAVPVLVVAVCFFFALDDDDDENGFIMCLMKYVREMSCRVRGGKNKVIIEGSRELRSV